MEPFDEAEMMAAIAASGARALLIGRRALIALGLPVLTADYDFWIDADDIAKLNTALAAMGFVASRSPEEARQRGRYVLEDGEHIDVMVARGVQTASGMLRFDDLWTRRVMLEVAPGVTIALPALDDLIATKRLGGRPKDAEDLRLLETLRTKT